VPEGASDGVGLTSPVRVPDDRSMGQRLRGPRELVVTSRLAPMEAEASLRQALAARRSLETGFDPSSDRRLAGTISDDGVHLRVLDARLWTRRKSWNIELDATLSLLAGGSILEGTIDIPDRRPLHILMWEFRALGAIPVLLVAALAVRDALGGNPVSISSVVPAVVVAIGFSVVTALMEADGERAAFGDADLLAGFLQRLLVGGETPPSVAAY
jgi:hypothetical protein